MVNGQRDTVLEKTIKWTEKKGQCRAEEADKVRHIDWLKDSYLCD